MVQKEKLLKDISYLVSALVALLLRAALKYLCNFGRGHHEEHFCEIILN